MQPFDNLKLYYARIRNLYYVYAGTGILSMALLFVIPIGTGTSVAKAALLTSLILGFLYFLFGLNSATQAGQFLRYLNQPEYKADFFYHRVMHEKQRRIRSIAVFALLFFGSIIFYAYSRLMNGNPMFVSRDEIMLSGILLGVAVHAVFNIFMLWYLHRQALTFLHGWI